MSRDDMAGRILAHAFHDELEKLSMARIGVSPTPEGYKIKEKQQKGEPLTPGDLYYQKKPETKHPVRRAIERTYTVDPVTKKKNFRARLPPEVVEKRLQTLAKNLQNHPDLGGINHYTGGGGKYHMDIRDGGNLIARLIMKDRPGLGHHEISTVYGPDFNIPRGSRNLTEAFPGNQKAKKAIKDIAKQYSRGLKEDMASRAARAAQRIARRR